MDWLTKGIMPFLICTTIIISSFLIPAFFPTDNKWQSNWNFLDLISHRHQMLINIQLESNAEMLNYYFTRNLGDTPTLRHQHCLAFWSGLTPRSCGWRLVLQLTDMKNQEPTRENQWDTRSYAETRCHKHQVLINNQVFSQSRVSWCHQGCGIMMRQSRMSGISHHPVANEQSSC